VSDPNRSGRLCSGGVWDDAEPLHHRHHVDDTPVLVRETVVAETE
jgi:hypothetical protein